MRLQYKKFLVLTKLRSTLKCEIVLQEKAKTTDNADAYRWFLTHYCDAISLFKEILPYGVSALNSPFVFSSKQQVVSSKGRDTACRVLQICTKPVGTVALVGPRRPRRSVSMPIDHCKLSWRAVCKSFRIVCPQFRIPLSEYTYTLPSKLYVCQPLVFGCIKA